jgi:hypothetical protein
MVFARPAGTAWTELAETAPAGMAVAEETDIRFHQGRKSRF